MIPSTHEVIYLFNLLSNKNNSAVDKLLLNSLDEAAFTRCHCVITRSPKKSCYTGKNVKSPIVLEKNIKSK